MNNQLLVGIVFTLILFARPQSVSAVNNPPTVTILPDSGVSGHKGAEVPNWNSAGTLKHFISPARNSDSYNLDTQYVELTASIEKGPFDNTYVWESVTTYPSGATNRGSVGAATNKFKVDRTSYGMTEVRIRGKNGGPVAAEMFVWVVWSDLTATKVSGPTHQPLAGIVNPQNQTGNGARIRSEWTFSATITPPEIITIPEAKRPDLQGASTAHVSEYLYRHALDGRILGDPPKKWDITRRMRLKVHSPNITPDQMEKLPANTNWNANLPNANVLPITTSVATDTDDYPLDKTEGNDNSQAGAKDVDPYNTNVGKLTDDDTPGFPVVLNKFGVQVNQTIEMRGHFEEFCRLQIGTQWYRISDRKPWRMHSLMKKTFLIGDDDEDMSGGQNGDEGKMRDNTSVSDTTNGGW